MTTQPLSKVFDQLDLFSALEKQTALPSNGTPTSGLAALKGRRKAVDDRLKILRLLEARGDYGAICDEAEVALGMVHQTCSARFSDLADDKQIETTLFTRRTRTGSPARVYVLRDEGRAVLIADAIARGDGDADGEAPAARQPSGLRANETEGGKRIEEVSSW